MNIDLLALGFHPTHKGDDLPMVPKSRYRAWKKYIKENDVKGGIDGLFCTSTVQVNLGYESEEDMVKKLRVALALQPIAVALFANSPFVEGQPSGEQSHRSHLIHNYMNGRYGFMLPVAFEEGFGFEKFVDYALNEMPMMGLYKDGVFIDAKGGMFSDFMEGKLAASPGQKATFADWENHLNTIWPEVRLRRFLEMRGADNGPAEMIKALPAFWVGLLYDKQSLDTAYEMIRDWTEEDRDYLRAQTPITGLQTPFMGTTVQDIAKNCLALSEAGLKRRDIRDEHGNDESVYLAPLHEIAESGMNLAQRLLEKFHNAWGGDIKPLFKEQSYENEPSILKRAIRSLSLSRSSAPHVPEK
jgi:glutamate--cysteine ligase